MSRPVVLAAFDVDGTLTRWDTLPFFLWSVVGTLKFGWKSLVLAPVLIRYVRGDLPNYIAKERVINRFLGGLRADQVEKSARRFSTDIMPYLLQDKGIERLRWHRKKGHLVTLVSATLECYLRPWAQQIHADHVIGTQLEINEEGYFTGRISGRNCHGPEKARRLCEEVSALGQREVYAYGNSVGDQELLELADHAFCYSSGSWEEY